MALTGYVRERLSFPRTVLAQLAASFAAFVTPPAVGGLAINIRYLRKAGLSPAGATTSVAVCQVVNSFSYFVLLIGFAAATGASSQHNVPIPSWAFFVIGGLIIVLLVAAHGSRAAALAAGQDRCPRCARRCRGCSTW